jgi:hypothetical protein
VKNTFLSLVAVDDSGKLLRAKSEGSIATTCRADPYESSFSETSPCGTKATRADILSLRYHEKSSPARDEATMSNDQSTTEIVSVGTQFHDSGRCKPCLYAFTSKSCSMGQNCNFCHSPSHQKKKTQRPCKAVRNQCKRLASTMASHGERLPDMTPYNTLRRPYMQKILNSKEFGLKAAEA